MIGLELVVILGAVILACGVLARRTGIAGPILLLLAGIGLGFAPELRDVHLPAELMLLVFLPMLLYWEALTTSLREIRATFRGIVLTSTLLVVATAAGVAAAAHALGVSWGPAWVLGAALAPTDATAVGALARSLPRRTVTVLRAESLVNDGTALVLYGVAVGVTVGEENLAAGHVAGVVAISYVGGILIGAVVAWLATLARRRIHDTVLSNVLVLLIPFTAYLLAELVEASGVLAVVVAGLVMSQVGPRIGTAAARQLTTGFWTLATYLLNAALFVLVGIEAHSSVRSLAGDELLTGILGVVVAFAVIGVVRFGFLVVSAYTIRLVDRRPSQRLRRVTNRARVVSTVAGFRGAVSLAVALSVPATLGSGAPFPDRDLIVFITAGVVATTLVVQGLLLGPTVRWAHLPDDDIHRERHLAETTATEEALDALPGLAASLGADSAVVDRLRGEFEEHLEILRARDGEAAAPAQAVQLHDGYTELRLALLARKRATVIRLRDQRHIDDTVLRQVQAHLDAEELRLDRTAGLSE
ncbi:Na+/H+ antiporter [Georgenia yuyongxinii]|uniref:Na+/H+ antiporter n=1 Tax=Georgenia yuyongxinii TaxID=2589797 RepID=A0A552WXG5_9MICO|nr:Na+/H+ antiporter [Georgenia yuyongxinii]TRW47279.1 Na+/H+ antiporter [Georgenia yuyongxinii]